MSYKTNIRRNHHIVTERDTLRIRREEPWLKKEIISYMMEKILMTVYIF